MEATQLLDLWDALEQRRQAFVQVSNSADDTARQAAQAELDALDSRVVQLQSALWDTYPQPFVRCRDIGHVWDVKNEALDDRQNLTRELQCYRCTTRRHDVVNRYGDLLSRSYIHAEDYVVKGGGGGRYGKPFWRGLTYMVVARR